MRFSISASDPKPVIDSIRSLVESQFGETAQPAPPAKPTARQTSPSLLLFRAGSRSVVLFCWTTIVASIPTYTVESAPDITREIARLRSAVAAAVAEFDDRIDRLRASLDRHDLEIFDAQRMIFADPTILKEVQAKIQEQHLNAAAAWHEILSRYAADQEKADDPYLRARAADFREVERTVLAHLIDEKKGSRIARPGVC